MAEAEKQSAAGEAAAAGPGAAARAGCCSAKCRSGGLLLSEVQVVEAVGGVPTELEEGQAAGGEEESI